MRHTETLGRALKLLVVSAQGHDAAAARPSEYMLTHCQSSDAQTLMLLSDCRHQLPDTVSGLPGGRLVARVHADRGLCTGHGADAPEVAVPLCV